jgi:uncharacterized protein YlxW (UPF0749 family)
MVRKNAFKLILFIAGVACGLLLVFGSKNVGVSGESDSIISILNNKEKSIEALSDDIAGLNNNISSYSAVVNGGGDYDDEIDYSLSNRLDSLKNANLYSGASGAGVIVTLDDAKQTGDVINGLSPNDYVIHQQDVQGFVNALYAGGASAIAIQGESLTPLSAVRCVGNVLLLKGKTYSPPYTIEAIGSAYKMEAALAKSNFVQIYMEYVNKLGLGYSFTESQHIAIKSSVFSDSLSYAHIL